VYKWLGSQSPSIPEQGVIIDCITAFSIQMLYWTGRGPTDESVAINSPFVAPVTYTETYSGNGSVTLFLRNTPIVSVSSLVIGNQAVLQSTAWGIPGWVIDFNNKAITIRRGGGGTGPTFFNFWGFNGGAWRFWEGPQNVAVNYTAGWNGVPPDLEMMARRVVSLNYKRKSWIGQSSQAMASGAGTVSYRNWELAQEDMRVIDNYRRVAMA
jgi:hypothetical protein